ncbi:hypothetical protein CYMTET_12984 [Cymbomonas tetramitiformis]|uniref:Uncharacterized protein n=1 Tax=Cymbomonas tetramitiformis TaxID=36881 RepID=A0AAE0GJ08_9CHLO|nr:hypothetical protein CYMTET_12984 [Cymbomonas tetramitiformis]
MDVQKFIKDFQFHIDAANEVFSSLKDNVNDAEPPTRWQAPSSGKPTGKPCAQFPPPPGVTARTAVGGDGKFHGRRRSHRFAASPLVKGGNWSQRHGH